MSGEGKENFLEGTFEVDLWVDGIIFGGAPTSVHFQNLGPLPLAQPCVKVRT